ncbi:pyridoxal phosphate-dependent aminotransferase [Erwinia sp. MYb416]|uniref:pyridoxal phosphate-dependent aminotransferase n=1 Tax=Erwinia sp. MYb416 TaxID=3108532 RepID=UPI0030B10A9C
MPICSNPGNPTGIVHSAEEIAALGRLVNRHNTLVIADEAYSDLVFTNRPFTSVLQVPAFAGRTLFCQTFSKSYAMTGWRVGYLSGPAEMISAAARVHNTVNGSVNSAVQRAALVALTECKDDVKRMYNVYRERRVLMMEGLATIPELTLNEPEGAFYCFPSYSLPIPAIDMVALLREQGIAVRPGSEFGAAGEGHLRLSYAAGSDAISEGIRRLRRGLAGLN